MERERDIWEIVACERERRDIVAGLHLLPLEALLVLLRLVETLGIAADARRRKVALASRWVDSNVNQ